MGSIPRTEQNRTKLLFFFSSHYNSIEYSFFFFFFLLSIRSIYFFSYILDRQICTYTLKKSSIRWRVPPPSASCEYTEAVALMIGTREKKERGKEEEEKSMHLPIVVVIHIYIHTHTRRVTDREQSDSYKIQFSVSSSLLHVSEIDCSQ